MSLVRFSYAENAIKDLNNKIRHTYDIHQLLKNKEIVEFFNAVKFDEMLLRVANDDIVSFKNNNQYLQNHPKDALLFSQPEKTWKQLKATYQGSFKTLVFGTYPDESQILKTILLIASRLEKINW